MKIPFNASIVSVLALSALPALATDVGVSVQISQPGVYGRIDIGRFPQPQVIVAQPVIMVQPRYVPVAPEPVYMWVPPGHQKNWRRYCGRYNACGVPVYFVQDGWYQQNVRSEPGEHPGKGNGKSKGKGKD
jgi:hypothetical protein